MDRTRILIVEDEGIAAINLEGQLQELGYQSAGIAFSAKEAIDKSYAVHPDLILMDIKLKGKTDGIEAAREVVRNLQIPIVFLTAYSDSVTLERAKEVGPFGYLVKPIRESTLKATIEMAIKKNRYENIMRRQMDRYRKRTLGQSARIDDLARLNRDLEFFSHVAAHDLKAPAQQISLFANLVAKNLENNQTEYASAQIEQIRGQAKSMEQMIDDLLSHSRLYSQDVFTQTCSLNQVLDDVLAILRPEIKEKHALITLTDLPTIYGNLAQLRRLFVNLLSNALKFNRGRPQVTLETRYTSQAVTILVKDNGIGIAPEHFPSLFKMFSRFHSPDEFPGTGVGLASCKKIMDNHNADIFVESEPGKGTTFYLCFSLARGH